METLANIPYIISNGGAHYKGIGVETSSGTKVFALVGKVKRTGLVEVPMGTTLRKLVFDIGGGIPDKREFKAVQTDGPSECIESGESRSIWGKEFTLLKCASCGRAFATREEYALALKKAAREDAGASDAALCDACRRKKARTFLPQLLEKVPDTFVEVFRRTQVRHKQIRTATQISNCGS